MARVKDLWFAEVPVKDADGKVKRGKDGRVVKERHKTVKHPDQGGSKTAKRWLAVWLDPDENEKTKAFAKREPAVAYGKKMESDAARGEYVDPKAGKGSFGELARKYIRLRKVGGSSRQRYESVFRIHVEPAFGHRPVGAVKVSDVIEWLGGELAGTGGSVQEAAYLIVAGTFDLAVADKMRHDNPARADIVDPPRAEESDRELWSADRVWAVIDRHPAEYRAIPVAAAGLGLRQGCALALAEEDFDFDAMKVTVRRQVERVGGKFYFKLPKGGKERVVPLPRGVAAVIRAHIEQYPPQPYSLPWLDEKGKTAQDPHECRLLFRWRGEDPRTKGKHIIASSYDQGVWKPALFRAGIAPAPVKDKRKILRYSSGGRQNGMHALRHFYSVLLQDAGISPVGAMDFMGHSKKALPVTFRVYGHVTEETFEQARTAVDARLFKLRPVQPSGTVTELRTAQ